MIDRATLDALADRYPAVPAGWIFATMRQCYNETADPEEVMVCLDANGVVENWPGREQAERVVQVVLGQLPHNRRVVEALDRGDAPVGADIDASSTHIIKRAHLSDVAFCFNGYVPEWATQAQREQAAKDAQRRRERDATLDPSRADPLCPGPVGVLAPVDAEMSRRVTCGQG